MAAPKAPPEPRPRRLPPPQAHSASPWLPPSYEDVDVMAIQALARGEAQPHQQKRALDWIIDSAAGTYDMSYRPGSDGRRDTDFAEGRRSVGLAIVKLVKLKIGMLRGKDGGREQG